MEREEKKERENKYMNQFKRKRHGVRVNEFEIKREREEKGENKNMNPFNL
jgi:hypothetical protein